MIDGEAMNAQQLVISGSFVNNGFTDIIGGSENTDGALIEFMAGSSAENNGSVLVTGGSGLGSGTWLVASDTTLVNNCGATMSFVGGSGEISGILLNSGTVTSSPVSSITFTPGTGSGSGELDGNAIIPGPECPQAVGGEFTPITSTALLLAGAQNMIAWMIPAIVSAIGIGIVIARKF